MTTPNTTPRGAADSPKLQLLLDSFPEQNPRNFDPDAAIQLNEWGIAIVEELYRLRTLAASAPVAPTQPASKRLIGWRTPDYLEETADAAMAKNWSVHHDLLPIFEGDVHTKLATPQAAPVAPAPQPAPVAEDVEDAARYQWIRGPVEESTRYSRWRIEYWDGPNGWQPMQRERMDAAIDAARAQAAQPEGGA